MSSMPQDFMFFLCYRGVRSIFLCIIFLCKERAICKMENMSWKRLKVTSKNFHAHHSC